MDLGLKGKVALVTGGSRGIGRHTAGVFAEEGCDVFICGRDADWVERSRAELSAMGVRAAGLAADVTQPDAAARVVDACVSQLGGIDILINNAGDSMGGSLFDATEEQWRATYEVNVFAPVRMARLAAPHIKSRGGGAIVNVSSISGVQPALSGTWQYGSSKAAQIFLTEVLALNLAADRIRVNVVSPGSIIWPDGSWDEFRKRHPESFRNYERDGFPMGRLGAPREVADVIVFVASPRANWINGRNIGVDGVEQPVAVREFRGW